MGQTTYRNPKSLRYQFRKRRIKHLVNLVDNVIKIHCLQTIKILDIGGNKIYWKIFPFEQFEQVQFEIDLINISNEVMFLEDNLRHSNLKFKNCVGDCTAMPHIASNEYHICHSNSVIEHVGSWDKVRKVVAESRRVASYFYHQTPNFWFPYEPHYRLPIVHWLPRPVITSLIKRFSTYNTFEKAKFKQDEICMLTYTDVKMLFPNDKIIKERYLLVKSFMAMSNF